VLCLVLNKYRLVPCTGINLAFIFERESVYCAVRTPCLNLAHVDLNLSRVQYCIFTAIDIQQSFIMLFNNVSCFSCSYGPSTVTKYIIKTQVYIRANTRNLRAHEIYNKIVKFKYQHLHNFENLSDILVIFLNGNYLRDRFLKYWQIFK